MAVFMLLFLCFLLLFIFVSFDVVWFAFFPLLFSPLCKATRGCFQLLLLSEDVAICN